MITLHHAAYDVCREASNLLRALTREAAITNKFFTLKLKVSVEGLQHDFAVYVFGKCVCLNI